MSNIQFFFFRDRGFDIKWVDDTHAIGVFSSSIAGQLMLWTLWIAEIKRCLPHELPFG
jgi:hypothetical protein